MFRKRGNLTLKNKLIEAGISLDGSWPSEFLLDLLNKYGYKDSENLVIEFRSMNAFFDYFYDTIYIFEDDECVVEISPRHLITSYLGDGDTLVWEIGIASPEDPDSWDKHSYISKYDVTGKKII